VWSSTGTVIGRENRSVRSKSCVTATVSEQLTGIMTRRFRNVTSKGRHTPYPVLTPPRTEDANSPPNTVPTLCDIHCCHQVAPSYVPLYPNSNTARTSQSFNTLKYVAVVPGPLQTSCQHNNSRAQTWNRCEMLTEILAACNHFNTVCLLFYTSLREAHEFRVPENKVPTSVWSMGKENTVELRTQAVPGDGSTFKLFDFRVKFPHKK
jgi:hypothetical protein